MIILALLSLAAVAMQDDPVVARQSVVPTDQVLGHKIKVDKTEQDAAKERKRHDRAMEKAAAKIRGNDSRWQLGHAGKQPKTVKTLPANANRY